MRSEGSVNGPLQTESGPRRVRASAFDLSAKKDVALPGPFVPVLPTTGGSEGVIKSYVLPSNKTGVMFVGSFGPDDFDGFQTDGIERGEHRGLLFTESHELEKEFTVIPRTRQMSASEQFV